MTTHHAPRTASFSESQQLQPVIIFCRDYQVRSEKRHTPHLPIDRQPALLHVHGRKTAVTVAV
jgi:hypothetical protein